MSAWVSPRVYAILNNSEDGKDIIERLGEMTQEECDKEVDAFFDEGGKGFSDASKYGQAKIDDETEKRIYEEMADEETKEKEEK